MDKFFMLLYNFKENNIIDYLKDEQISDFLNANSDKYKKILDTKLKAKYKKYQDMCKATGTSPVKYTKWKQTKTPKELFQMLNTSKYRKPLIHNLNSWIAKNNISIPDFKKLEKIKPNYTELVQNHKKVANFSKEERDNILLDIMRSILTHPDMASTWLSSGHYREITKEANINRILEDLTARKGVAEQLKCKEEDLRTNLADFTEKEIKTLYDTYKTKEPLNSVITFENYALQNFAGLSLVGIAANGSVFHSKTLGKNLKLVNGFEFEGYTFSNLTGMYTCDKKQLITDLFAQYCAAAVDNGKDPQLAMMLQSPNSAFITMYFMMLGMPFRYINAILSQPVIKQILTGDYNLYSLENYLDDLQSEAEYAGVKDYNDKTKDSEFFNLKNFEKQTFTKIPIIYAEGKSNLSKEETKKYYTQSIRTLKWFIDRVEEAGELRNLISRCRADSPNGAAPSELDKLFTEVSRVNSLKFKTLQGADDLIKNDKIKDFSKAVREKTEALLEHFNDENSIEVAQTMYTLGKESILSLLEPYFTVCNPEIKERILDLGNTSAWGVSKKFTDTYLKALQLYQLSGTTLFGDSSDNTFNEKKLYFEKLFPREFNTIKQEIITQSSETVSGSYVRLLQLLKLKNTKNGKIITLSEDADSKKVQDELSYTLYDMLINGNTKEKDLAVKLVQYAYFVEEFKWGGSNINGIIGDLVKSSLPDYINTMRNISSIVQKKEDLDKFELLFIVNNPQFVPKTRITKKNNSFFRINAADNTIEIKNSFTAIQHPNKEGEYFKYLNIDGKIYKKIGDNVIGQTTYIRYVQLPILKFGKKRVPYNKNLDLTKQNQDVIEKMEAVVSEKEGTVKVSKANYTKATSKNHPNTRIIFTENAQAFIETLVQTGELNEDAAGSLVNTNSIPVIKEGVTLNVSAGKRGTNQAVVRTDDLGNINENTFGIIVKKYQQDSEGNWLYSEGLFEDTDEDFNLFKELNIKAFERIKNSKLSNVLLPASLAGGKARLPKRFAEWLVQQLKDELNVTSFAFKNSQSDGFTLLINPNPYRRTTEFENSFTIGNGDKNSVNRSLSEDIAKFSNNEIVTINGTQIDVSNLTIKEAFELIKNEYKSLLKQNADNNPDDIENDFWDVYLPLWQLWANNNSLTIQQLAILSRNLPLSDSNSNLLHSPARALAYILNTKIGLEAENRVQDTEYDAEIITATPANTFESNTNTPDEEEDNNSQNNSNDINEGQKIDLAEAEKLYNLVAQALNGFENFMLIVDTLADKYKHIYPEYLLSEVKEIFKEDINNTIRNISENPQEFKEALEKIDNDEFKNKLKELDSEQLCKSKI